MFTCQLSCYPEYLHKAMGFDFSERFHTDSMYRNEKWKEVLRWIHARFGRWRCGSAEPQDAYSATTLDSVHLTAYLFGSRVRYFVDNFPDSHDYPQSELSALQAFAWRTEPVKKRIDALLQETRRLVERFGPSKVSFPYYLGEDAGMRDLEHTHCPLTISYRLFGERLFIEMYDNPEAVGHVFRSLTDMSLELSAAFRGLLGIPKPAGACIGACALALVGVDQFTDLLRPAFEAFADGRQLYFHSCGNVNKHLEALSELNETIPIRVFDCREQSSIDLCKLAESFPGTTISYMLSPPACLTRSPEDIARVVRETVEKTAGNPLHLILNLPAGVEDALVDAFFETCVALGAQLPQGGFSFS